MALAVRHKPTDCQKDKQPLSGRAGTPLQKCHKAATPVKAALKT